MIVGAVVENENAERSLDCQDRDSNGDDEEQDEEDEEDELIPPD